MLIHTEPCTKPSDQPPIGSKWIQGCTNTSSNVLFKAFGKALSSGDNSPPVKGWMLPLCFSTALPSLCFFSSLHIPRHRSLLPRLLSTYQVVYFKKTSKSLCLNSGRFVNFLLRMFDTSRARKLGLTCCLCSVASSSLDFHSHLNQNLLITLNNLRSSSAFFSSVLSFTKINTSTAFQCLSDLCFWL